ncbi:hypothetical protein B0T24DRAFT_168526 [Lasiosphaeria ovina]|uniref:Secreted protein n=1 Tax=Lasiosphaeria ovina TaxID=92902 RepID=A0AAE0NE30_9PEZI|nr:hypothetical protein B0T24DRAFT_168526 [Lasiosphaeria ovina]
MYLSPPKISIFLMALLTCHGKDATNCRTKLWPSCFGSSAAKAGPQISAMPTSRAVNAIFFSPEKLTRHYCS